MGRFFNNIGQTPREDEIFLSPDKHHLYHGVNGKWVEYSKSWKDRWEEGCSSVEEGENTWEAIKAFGAFDNRPRPLVALSIEEHKEYIYHEDTDTWEEREPFAIGGIRSDLVPVQPMAPPMGLCSYMDVPIITKSKGKVKHKRK